MAPVTLESEFLAHELTQMAQIAKAIGPTLDSLYAEWWVSERAHTVMRQRAHEIPWMTYEPRTLNRLVFAGKDVVARAWDVDTWQVKLVVTGVRDGAS
ncbi:MAG TPA: hypothetical protein VF454_04945 [Gemmatimonadales bacterium]